MKSPLNPPCPTCGATMLQTRSGFYGCPNGHGKLLTKRDATYLSDQAASLRAARRYELWLQTDEGKAAQERWKKTEQRNKERKENRQRKITELAKLPFAHLTGHRNIIKIQGQHGLYRKSGHNKRGAIHVLLVPSGHKAWVRMLSDAEIDTELTQ